MTKKIRMKAGLQFHTFCFRVRALSTNQTTGSHDVQGHVGPENGGYIHSSHCYVWRGIGDTVDQNAGNTCSR